MSRAPFSANDARIAALVVGTLATPFSSNVSNPPEIE